MNHKKSFDALGYSYIKNTFNEQQRKDITERIFREYYMSTTIRMPDAPLSDSVSNLFDDYTLEMTPFFEKCMDLRLYPTYSFARIYRNGEILHPHIDRESCEFTVTCTINFEADSVWPIFLKDRQDNVCRVNIDPGDSLIFGGCALEHWRDKFEGEYQIQLFLHYVNADGPFSHWKHDKGLMITV